MSRTPIVTTPCTELTVLPAANQATARMCNEADDASTLSIDRMTLGAAETVCKSAATTSSSSPCFSTVWCAASSSASTAASDSCRLSKLLTARCLPTAQACVVELQYTGVDAKRANYDIVDNSTSPQATPLEAWPSSPFLGARRSDVVAEDSSLSSFGESVVRMVTKPTESSLKSKPLLRNTSLLHVARHFSCGGADLLHVDPEGLHWACPLQGPSEEVWQSVESAGGNEQLLGSTELLLGAAGNARCVGDGGQLRKHCMEGCSGEAVCAAQGTDAVRCASVNNGQTISENTNTNKDIAAVVDIRHDHTRRTMDSTTSAAPGNAQCKHEAVTSGTVTRVSAPLSTKGGGRVHKGRIQQKKKQLSSSRAKQQPPPPPLSEVLLNLLRESAATVDDREKESASVPWIDTDTANWHKNSENLKQEDDSTNNDFSWPYNQKMQNIKKGKTCPTLHHGHAYSASGSSNACNSTAASDACSVANRGTCVDSASTYSGAASTTAAETPRLLRNFPYYKTKLCPRLKSNGCCAKLDKCTFAHSSEEIRSLPNLVNTTLCESVRCSGGKCANPSCRFAHTVEELRHTEQFFKTKMCHMWKRGRCLAGDVCRHAHGNHEVRRANYMTTNAAPPSCHASHKETS